jgi:hypothetical protein
VAHRLGDTEYDSPKERFVYYKDKESEGPTKGNAIDVQTSGRRDRKGFLGRSCHWLGFMDAIGQSSRSISAL